MNVKMSWWIFCKGELSTLYLNLIRGFQFDLTILSRTESLHRTTVNTIGRCKEQCIVNTWDSMDT